MRQFYFKARDDVFHDPKGGLSFDSDALQTKLQIEFGTEMRMNDVKYPRYIFIYLSRAHNPRVCIMHSCPVYNYTYIHCAGLCSL